MAKREAVTIQVDDTVLEATRHLRKLKLSLANIAAMEATGIDLFRSDFERLRRASKARKIDTLMYLGITLRSGRMRRGRADGSTI